MVYIDESKLAAYRNTIRDHKRELKFADAHEASISRKGGMNLEMEQVAAQVDESIFCVADYNSHCECPACKKYEAESMDDARVSWKAKQADDECDCGGTFDEYDRCSDCANGHQDCELNECPQCFERAQDRAESAAEGMER